MAYYNILFIYPTMFHPERGGVERVTDILAKEFRNRGHNIFYLNNIYNKSLDNYEYPASMDFFPDGKNLSKKNIDFYNEFLEKNNIDIIVNQTGLFGDSKLYLSFNNKKIKSISVLHSNPLLNYNYLYAELFRLRNNSLLEKFKLCGRFILYPLLKYKYKQRLKEHYSWLIHNTDRICLLSSRYLSELQKLKILIKQNQIISIPNPNTYSVKNLTGIKKEKIILYVGRLDYGQKRTDRLLSIWKKIYKNNPNWKLIIVGDGPERNNLERKAQNMERVDFVGFTNPENYYRKSLILCLTSNFEGWPMVLVEGMANGCIPILFNSYLAASDIVDNEINGFLVDAFNLDQYADKLNLLMNDNVMLNNMSKKAIRKSLNFDIIQVANIWEKVFKEIAE